ncbi:MAG: hypothetical protein HQL30_10920 [Candidatus Omnitrophica bacterium]|nr:hypothetical protein [Candidatus Omnitrophota bacterium]
MNITQIAAKIVLPVGIVAAVCFKISPASAFDETIMIPKIIKENSEIKTVGTKNESGIQYRGEKVPNKEQIDQQNNKLALGAAKLNTGKSQLLTPIADLKIFMNRSTVEDNELKNELAGLDKRLSGELKITDVEKAADRPFVEELNGNKSLPINKASEISYDNDLVREIESLKNLGEIAGVIDPKKLCASIDGANSTDIAAKLELKSAIAVTVVPEGARNAKAIVIDKGTIEEVVNRNEMTASMAPAANGSNIEENTAIIPLIGKIKS